MKRKLIGGLLAAAMIFNLSMSMVPARQAEAAENPNLALNKTVTASSFEVERTNAEKAVDGDLDTRWGTAENKAVDEWIEIDLGEAQNIKQININFERTDANQNILGYKVELKNDGDYEQVHIKNERAKQKEVIQLETAKQARYVKVTILDANGGLNPVWENVSIAELEVYSELIEEADATPDTNHMSNATVTASTNEVAALSPDKVKDGKFGRQDRWASTDADSDKWLNSEFAGLTSVKEIHIYLFTRDVAPMPSNVQSFDIKYTDKDGNEQLLKSITNEVKDDGFETDLRIRLDEAVEAKSIKLCNFVVKGNQYPGVSVVELEVYSNDQEEQVTLDSVVKALEEKNDLTIEDALPTAEELGVPEGYTVKFNCADYEQLVVKGEDDEISITRPLTNKTVQISYTVTEDATDESTKVTADIPHTVKGMNEQAEDKNAKPVIIPEIAEWYSDSTAKLAVSDITKVRYDDASLETVVNEFVADYEDFTGVKLTSEQGKEAKNAFNFSIDASDKQLGEEGYTMDIQDDRVLVKSESITGNMYGMQTILQMYKQDTDGFAVGQMRDYPRFETRGFLFDVARKPVSMEMIKEVSRTMRYYKMNDYQVHLSDNYIFLEQYGKGDQENEAFKAYEAFRLESGLTNEAGKSPTAQDYSISKADFREFIQSERALGMKIVPEIDVPAHSTSFTKIWPELMVANKVSPLNGNRPLVDHLDVSKPETVAKIKEIFDDYTKGSNPTFDSETTVHIGADEFLANYTAYREFVNAIVPHVKETNPTVRMWGGLTWIDDGKTEIIPEAIENVEMNLWSKDWADGKQMYDMGYKLINTIDSYGYMVPDGNMGRGSYKDLLNVNGVFNNFAPNLLSTRNGWQYVPSGDDQMMGAAFAIWSDNIDKSASGLTESDLYWRFFDAMPFYAEKTWAATGKEKESAANLTALAAKMGTGPRTNPYYQEDKTGSDYESYDFNKGNGLADGSENSRDLSLDGSTAKVENNALAIGGENSYATSPIEVLGNGNELSFDITLSDIAKPGDIIFEEDAAYGTHDIRIMEDGKLGFTRELYNYYFDYELPVGKKVNVKITVDQQVTKLYVDGEFVANATGKFIHNDIVKKENITAATFALPLERIGSKTNAIDAVIDNVVVSEIGEAEDTYNKAKWKGTATSENALYDGIEGPIELAFDNNPKTHWHTDWQQGTGQLDGTNSFEAEIDFRQKYTINEFSFTPRTDTASGRVTKADLYIKASEDGEWKKVAADQTFAADGSKKTFMFDVQEVQFVKFVAKDVEPYKNEKYVAVSEFDIADTSKLTYSVYVKAEEGGTVAGGKEAAMGEEVTVTATPNAKYHFVGWYDALDQEVSTEAEYTFTVTGHTSLIAKFEQDPIVTHTVSVDVNDTAMGTAAMDKTDGVYEEGTNASVTATANDGYEFVNWTDAGGNAVSTSNPYAFEVTADTALTANFKVKEVTPDPDEPTAEEVLKDIIAKGLIQDTLEADTKEFALPEVPEGFKISITKVNPEGIIGLDGKVTTPEKDTEIVVTITVTDADGNEASADVCVKAEGKSNPKQPEIIEGNNGVFEEGSNKPLEFRADIEIKNFKEVRVDGKVVDPSNYDVKEGSTIIIFKDSYLKTLAVGEHTISIVANDGKAAEGKFTVKAKTDSDNVDKSKLEKFYNECLAYYKEANHSEANWKAYQTALTEVKAVLDNPKATEKDVQKALNGLVDITKKMNKELENPTDVPKEPKPDSNGGKDTVKTGDATPIMMWTVLLAASGMVLVMRRKRVR